MNSQVGIPPNEMAFLFCGSIVLFVLRDTWTPEGRSLGKKICGLEIVQLEKTKVVMIFSDSCGLFVALG